MHGWEPLLVDEVLDRIVAAILPDPASAAWNREVLYADSATPDAIVMAGSTLGLFGGRRLVLVRGFADASAKVVDRLRKAIDDARAGSGGWPCEGTTVVFVAGATDRRAPALRLVPESEQVEVRGPVGRAVLPWLMERARAAGLEVSPKAAQALFELVGDDLARLAGEIEKATVYAGADRRLSEDIARALAGETRVRQYWELTQALEEGRRAEALRLLERLFAEGDEPLVVLACVVGYIRDLWRVLPGVIERSDPRQVAPLLPRRRPDWAVERLMTRAATLGPAGIATAVRRCFEVERTLKTSGASPRPLLTVLVAELAR